MRGLLRQQELLGRVVEEITAGAPEGWSCIEVSLYMIGRYSQMEFIIYVGDEPFKGGPRLVYPPSAAELRHIMYIEGRGAWLTLSLTIWSSGEVGSAFDYDNRPSYELSHAEHIAEELVMYPREVVPQWMIEEQAAGDTHPVPVIVPPPTFDESLAELLSDTEPAVDRETARERARGFVPEGPDWRYVRIAYSERAATDPVVVYIEADGEGLEWRRMEVFHTGFMDYADYMSSGQLTSLGFDPLPPVDEIAQQPHVVEAEEIAPERFQEEWIFASGLD